jgi:hypothetical protein
MLLHIVAACAKPGIGFTFIDNRHAAEGYHDDGHDDNIGNHADLEPIDLFLDPGCILFKRLFLFGFGFGHEILAPFPCCASSETAPEEKTE